MPRSPRHLPTDVSLPNQRHRTLSDLKGKTENMGVWTKERKGVTAEVLMATPCTMHWEVKVGGTSMKDVGGAGFAGSSPPFLGREWAAVNVDVGP